MDGSWWSCNRKNKKVDHGMAVIRKGRGEGMRPSEVRHSWAVDDCL